MKIIRRLAVFFLIAAFALAAAYAVVVVRYGFSARATPSRAEILLATTARSLAVPSGYRQLHNPFSASTENVNAGMEHFADHCATCHGNNGSGDTLLGNGMYPKPPDMRQAATQNKSDGELYYIIENGIRLSGMPAFGENPGTNDAETWHLVTFIRHMPQLTAEELAKMAALNPKTDEDRTEEQDEQDFLNGGNSRQTNSSSHHH